MPARKITEGRGITKRERTVFDAPFSKEDQDEIAAALQECARQNDLEAVLADIERMAAGILAAAGLPTEFSRDGGRGVRPVAKKRGFEPDSQEGYAATAVDKIAFIRMARKQGYADQAVLEALRLGATLGESWIREAYAERSRRGGRQPGANAERNEKMAREYLDRLPHARMSETALKEDIGKHLKRWGYENLGRQASIDAVKDGLAILKKLSG